jgi:predicted nucleic acid-binding protein
VTHPRIYTPPSAADEAVAQVDAWTESPSVVLLGEGVDHWTRLRGLLASGRATGGRVHDARIAAICLSHGVRTLWTADRDFSRFPELAVRNPLVG